MIFEEAAVSIDAAIVAERFAIEPALVQPLMRGGKITSRYERGATEDAVIGFPLRGSSPVADLLD